MSTSALSAVMSRRDFDQRIPLLYKSLLSIAEKKIGPNDAEDLVLRVLAAAWNKIHCFNATVSRLDQEGNKPFFLWLCKFLDFEIKHYYREQARQSETFLPAEAVFSLLEGPDQEWIEELQWQRQRIELRRRVHAAVLTPRQRFCILNWLDGHSLHWIGQQFPEPICRQAVRKIILRVRRLLETLDSDVDDPEVLECIKNEPTAVVYYGADNAVDHNGTSAEIEARRWYVRYTHYYYEEGALKSEIRHDRIQRRGN